MIRMARGIYLLTLTLMLLLSGMSMAKEEFKVNVSGLYNATGYSQNNFNLGKTGYKDEYFVQMLRLRLSFGYGEHVKAITRLDLGQGWWGVDNIPPSYRIAFASALFDNKDTNYFLHVDQAYIWFDVPSLKAEFRVGRFNWSVGHRLVLDNNYDGIDATFQIAEGYALHLGWAKISEGVASISDLPETKPDERGNTDGRDANLVLASFRFSRNKSALDTYFLYYRDGSFRDGVAYLIDGLYYNRPRFTPQVTKLFILGFSGKTKTGALKLEGEANVLFGKDEIANETHAGFLNTNPGAIDPLKYDINNGDLFGYNIFLKLSYLVSKNWTLGLVAGMGSGDDDPTSGKGNVNKLRTSGFFYITEVWEDSIMPDEEGISPQGLGAPNVRAYRELENTTLFQFFVRVKLSRSLKLFSSLTWLHATQPIYAWTAEGPDLSRSSRDLGWEIDGRLDYILHDGLTLILRAGYLFAGDGARYLVMGHNSTTENAWEFRTTILYKF